MKVMPFKFELGEVLKDVVTGFEGVVMARTQYHTGCNHYSLEARKVTKEGKTPQWEGLDESRLVRTKKKRIRLNQEKPTSGAFPNPPKM